MMVNRFKFKDTLVIKMSSFELNLRTLMDF